MTSDRSRVVYIAAGGLALILAIWLGLAASDMASHGGDDVARLRLDLDRMRTLAAEYNNLAEERERLASAGNRTQGTLYAILDGIVRGHGISRNVRFMKPLMREVDGGLKEELVSMGMTGLYSDELVRFLHQVEIGVDGLYVESANIRRTKGGKLDAELTVSMAVTGG